MAITKSGCRKVSVAHGSAAERRLGASKGGGRPAGEGTEHPTPTGSRTSRSAAVRVLLSDPEWRGFSGIQSTWTPGPSRSPAAPTRR